MTEKPRTINIYAITDLSKSIASVLPWVFLIVLVVAIVVYSITSSVEPLRNEEAERLKIIEMATENPQLRPFVLKALSDDVLTYDEWRGIQDADLRLRGEEMMKGWKK